MLRWIKVIYPIKGNAKGVIGTLFCLRCITDDLFTMIYLFILLEQWRNTRWEAVECFHSGLLPNQTYSLGILTLVSMAYIHNMLVQQLWKWDPSWGGIASLLWAKCGIEMHSLQAEIILIVTTYDLLNVSYFRDII